MATVLKQERVIVREVGSSNEVEATLHYDVEGSDLELRQGEKALETGSWPLQSFEIIGYLDRVSEV